MQGLSVSIVPDWECLEYRVPIRKLLFGLILFGQIIVSQPLRPKIKADQPRITHYQPPRPHRRKRRPLAARL